MQFKKSILSVLIKSALTTTVLAPSLLFAQDDDSPQLEEIVVTAQQREQTLADVPLSVAVVDGDLIRDQGMENMTDLQYSVPNFSQSETAIGTNIFIRGIGSGNNQGFEQSVGIYVDGIHHGRAQQARAPFMDLARVEVLRGPQSILFGKNSVAGALNITTAKPTDEFEGFFNLSHEFIDGATEGTIVLSGPLSDKFRYRIAGRSSQTDGFIENPILDRTEPSNDNKTLRTTFEYDFSDTVMATLKIEKSQFDVVGRPTEVTAESPAAAGPFAGLTYAEILVNVFGQDTSLLDNTVNGARTSNGDFSNNDQFEAVFTVDWELENSTFRSVTGISNYKFDDLCDCDFTGANIFSVDLAEKYDQFSQEFRLTSNGGETLDYIVGGFFQTSDHEYSDSINVTDTSLLVPLLNANPAFPAGFNAGNLFANTAAVRNAVVDSDVFSAFGQIDWHFNDTMTLQLGGRITHESKEGTRDMRIVSLPSRGELPADQAIVADLYAAVFGISASNALNIAFPVADTFGSHPVAGSISETAFTPDIKLYWDVSDDTMLYVSAVKGSKSSGFDFRANNRGASATIEDSFIFDNESAINFEFGGKLALLDGAAEVNFAAYFTKFEDLQVSTFDGLLGFNVGNAAKADVKGFEIDGRWQASQNLTLGGSLAFNDFQFKDYTNGQCYFGQAPNGPQAAEGFCDYEGEPNRMAADFQGTFFANHYHEFAGNWELISSYNAFFTGGYNASGTSDPLADQDGFAKHNFRFALENTNNGWGFALLFENVTDEKVMFNFGATPLSGSTFGAGSNVAVMGQGRTTALQLSKKF